MVPLDISNLLFPKVFSVNIDAPLISLPADYVSSFSALANIYDTFKAGTPIGSQIDEYAQLHTTMSASVIVEKSLMGRKRLAMVSTNVGDYIKKREVSENSRKHARSRKALDNYRQQIREITRGLVYEFQNVPLHLRGQLDFSQDSKVSDVRESFMHYLETKGFYPTIKDTMKRAVIQVVQEVRHDHITRETYYYDNFIALWKGLCILKQGRTSDIPK